MIKRPLVAVVTLNWNGAAFLRECVDSILASDYANFKVIVVDNGSTDNSLKLMQDTYGDNVQVTLLQNHRNLGYSLGMNAGLKHAFGSLRADYCLVMNNDTVLDREAISALVDMALTDEKIAFVTGKAYYFDQPDVFQSVGKKSHSVLVSGGHIGRGEKDLGQYDVDRELHFCDDIFWLVSRMVYEETGGYDPEFFLQCEDFDWQLRAKKAGFKIMYAHKARLWHRESMVLGKRSARKAYYDARNPAIAVMKNCDPQTAKRFLQARLFKVYLPAIAKNTIRARFNVSCAMTWGLLSAGIWSLKHHGCSDRQLTKRIRKQNA